MWFRSLFAVVLRTRRPAKLMIRWIQQETGGQVMASRHSTLAMLVAAFALAAQAQTPTITSVVNSASQVSQLSPGTLADVNGSNLSTLSTDVALVGGTRRATVISRSSSKWVIAIPFGLAPGATTVEVGNSPQFPVTLSTFSPAIFSVDGTGGGIARGQVNHSSSTYPLSTANPAHLGDLLVIDATGLGPIDPNEGNSTLETPIVTVGGAPMLVSGAFQATAPSTDTSDNPTKCLSSTCTNGMYQVLVALPPAMQIGSQNPIVLTVGGQTTQAQSLSIPIGKNPVLNSVVNAGSFSRSAPLVPGSLGTVFGTTFGLTDQAAGFPSTSFQGLSVSFNGTKAPLLFLGTDIRDLFGQVNLQLPVELPEAGPVTVKVSTADGDSDALTVQMASAAPGLFTFYQQSNPQRHNAVALVEGTNWLVTPSDLATQAGIPTNCRAGGVSGSTVCGEPAKRLDFILIYATGMGKAYPGGDSSKAPLATGSLAPASPAYSPATTPSITIGPATATVSSVTAVPGTAGVFALRVQIPSNAPVGDDVPVVVTATNNQADAGTTIAIQQ
jgi:uncharacterized protein (TIGR03437 family)